MTDDLNKLSECPDGHVPETWLCNSWVLVGCKKCGIAVAAYKSFEQSEHDWNVIMRTVHSHD